MNNAAITLDELIEQTTPMTLIEKIEHIGGYLSDAAKIATKASLSFAALSRSAFELANTWRDQA